MGELGNLTVRLALESQKFQEGIKTANREIRNAQSEFKNAGAGVKDYETSLDGLKGKSEMLARQVEAQNTVVEMNKTKFAESKETLNQNVEAQEKLATKVKDAKQAYEESKATLGENAEETKKLKEEYNKLSEEYDTNNEKISNNVKTMENWENKANNSEAKLKNLQAELKNTNKEIEVQSSKWTQFGDKLEESSKKLEATGERMTSVGKGMTTKITAPLMAIGTAAAKVGMDFEASMSNVKALAQPTQAEFEALGEKAREMGAKTSKSAQESADALGYMALSGWDTTQMMEGLEPVLHLSEAGNIDLARASSLVTDSMSAMGLEVQDLSGYLDQVAHTARSSSTDIDQMMEAYLGVGGTLKGLNVDLEDGALALAMLANAGIKGSEGGKALSAVLNNLTAPLGRSKKALDELGYSAFDNQGNFKGIETVITELNGKFSDMDMETRNMYISMIAGKEHLKSFNALLNGVADDGFENLKSEINSSNGALKEMRDVMQDNNKGSITELKSAVQELGHKIYDSLKPAIADLIDLLKSWTDKLNNLTPAQIDTITNIAKMIAKIGPLLLVGGKLTKGIGSIGLKLAGLSKDIGLAGGEFTLLGVTMKALPFLGVVGGVGAVAGGIYALVKHLSKASAETDIFKDSLDISAETQSAVNSYREMSEAFEVNLKTAAYSHDRVTKESFSKTKQELSQMTDFIRENTKGNLETSKEVLQGYLDESHQYSEAERTRMMEKLDRTNEERLAKIDKVEKEILAIKQEALNQNRELKEEEVVAISRLNDELTDLAIQSVSKSEEEIMAIETRLWNSRGDLTAEQTSNIIKQSKKATDEEIDIIKKKTDDIITEANYQADQLGSISSEERDKIIEDALKMEKEAIDKAKSRHKGVVDEAMKQADEHGKLVDEETGELKSKWQVAKDSVLGTVSEMTSEMKDKWNTSLTDLSNIWSNIKQNAKQTWTEQKKETVTVVKQTISDIKRDWQDNISKLKDLARRNGDAIKQGLESRKQAIVNKAKEIANNTNKKFQEAKSGARKAGQDLVEGFKNGIEFTKSLAAKAKSVGERTLSALKRSLDSHSPSRKAMKIGEDTGLGFEIGLDNSIDGAEKKAENLAKSTLKAMQSEMKDAELTVPKNILKSQTSSALSGKNKNYAKFASKLKADELEETKKMLEADYKARERALNKKINSLDKKKHKNQIEQTKKNKEALRERNEDVKQILDDRLAIVNEKMEKESNIFTDKMNAYDNAIKKLSKTTNDLSQELINNNAIYILQSEKVAELEKQHKKMTKEFGSSSTEAIKLKKTLEEAKIQYEDYGNAIIETENKIRQSQIDIVNDTTDRIKNALRQKYQEEQSIAENVIQANLDGLAKWEKESKDKINSVYDEKVKLIKESSDTAIKELQREIDAINDMQKEEEREDINKKELKEIADLEESLLYEHDEYNKLEIQKKVATLKKNREKRLKKQALEDQKKALQDEINLIKEKTNEEISIMEEKKKQEIDRIDSIAEYERESLEQALENIKIFYSNRLGEAVLHAEAEKMVINNNQKEIIKLLYKYEEDYNQVGQSLGEKLVEGFNKEIQGIQQTIDELNNQINATRNKAISEMTGKANKVNNTSTRSIDNTRVNTVNIYSNEKLDHYNTQKETENTLRRLALGGI